MANSLADKGLVVNAPNQGAMKTILANWRDFTSNMLGGWQFESITPAAFTVTSGILSVSQDYGIGGYILVSRAAGITTAFDLTGITATNFKPGQVLLIATEATKPMTVHHQQSGVANGQIILRGGQDVILNDQESCIALRLEGATGPWREIWRSSGATGGGLSGLNIRVITAPSSTYEKPSNLVSAIVIVVGAGGGGAGKPRTNSTAITLASGGGGAGAYAVKFFDEADLPASCVMRVGAAGTGGSDATTYTAGSPRTAHAVGTSGGGSSFSGTGITTITADGGSAGEAFVRGRSGIGLTAGQNDSAQGGVAAGGDINVNGNAGYPGLAMDIDDTTRLHNELGGRPGGSPFAGDLHVLYNADAPSYPAGQYGAGGAAPWGGTGTWASAYDGGDGAPGVIFIIEVLN